MKLAKVLTMLSLSATASAIVAGVICPSHACHSMTFARSGADLVLSESGESRLDERLLPSHDRDLPVRDHAGGSATGDLVTKARENKGNGWRSPDSGHAELIEDPGMSGPYSTIVPLKARPLPGPTALKEDVQDITDSFVDFKPDYSRALEIDEIDDSGTGLNQGARYQAPPEPTTGPQKFENGLNQGIDYSEPDAKQEAVPGSLLQYDDFNPEAAIGPEPTFQGASPEVQTIKDW